MPGKTSQPFVVGIGGTSKSGSSSERALAIALEEATGAGARTELFGGTFLAGLPLYSPVGQARSEAQRRLVEAVRRADGVIIATPAYHAGMSGLVKNAIDLLEDLHDDARPYLHGRAVGCIITAFGAQGGGTTLTSVRSIVHALRGWPTPLGVTLNTAERVFDETGTCVDQRAATQLAMVGRQVVEFARARSASVEP